MTYELIGRGESLEMIAKDMNRAARLVRDRQWDSLRRTYERVLRLVDLTVGTRSRRGLRRRLLRWRDLIAALFIAPEPAAVDHTRAFRALLQLTPTAAKQIPYALG